MNVRSFLAICLLSISGMVYSAQSGKNSAEEEKRKALEAKWSKISLGAASQDKDTMARHLVEFQGWLGSIVCESMLPRSQGKGVKFSAKNEESKQDK